MYSNPIFINFYKNKAIYKKIKESNIYNYCFEVYNAFDLNFDFISLVNKALNNFRKQFSITLF